MLLNLRPSRPVLNLAACQLGVGVTRGWVFAYLLIRETLASGVGAGFNALLGLLLGAAFAVFIAGAARGRVRPRTQFRTAIAASMLVAAEALLIGAIPAPFALGLYAIAFTFIRAGVKAQMRKRSEDETALLFGMIANMTGQLIAGGGAGIVYATYGQEATAAVGAALTILASAPMLRLRYQRVERKGCVDASLAAIAKEHWRVLVRSAILLQFYGAVSHGLRPYVITWYGEQWVGLDQAAHVAGMFAAFAAVAVLAHFASKASSSQTFMFSVCAVGSLMLAPHGLLVMALGKTASSTTGHIVQARNDADVLDATDAPEAMMMLNSALSAGVGAFALVSFGWLAEATSFMAAAAVFAVPPAVAAVVSHPAATGISLARLRAALRPA